jgi:hypothetical protein
MNLAVQPVISVFAFRVCSQSTSEPVPAWSRPEGGYYGELLL